MKESPPTRMISDQFRIVERIGRGGFGTVWRAVNDQNNDFPDVAVKFPRKDGNKSNESSEILPRFRNESRILSRFEGGVLPTSIVRYVEGRQQDPMYIVLEYIEGTELSERVTKSDIEPGLKAAKRFGFPIIRALEFLHRNQICYLDCKPENILVRERDDTPVLIDFNTAELTSSANTILHEDEYKAPEQIPSDEWSADPGPHSDVYAVGKLLCFLFTGFTLTTSSTPPDGMDIFEYDCDVPTRVRKILRQATAADTTRRPKDAGELLTALYDAYGQETAVAELSDERTNAFCPIRTGETIGRVTNNGPIPDVAVADQDKCVSPIHLELSADTEAWLVRDRSLNGTHVKTDTGWQQLLSSEGYKRLKHNSPTEAPNEQPYSIARINEMTKLSLVDPSYGIDFGFQPYSTLDNRNQEV